MLCEGTLAYSSSSTQLWDLRFAASPVKVFEKHEKGILSIAWCPQDSDLLLSAGKDNHVFCFNPNSAEYGGEVSSLIGRYSRTMCSVMCIALVMFTSKMYCTVCVYACPYIHMRVLYA